MSDARSLPAPRAAAALLGLGLVLALAAPAGADETEHPAAAAHAAAHARAAVLRERWQRLTPAQREQRLAAAARDTQALNARLAGSRDEVGFWDPSLHRLPEFAIDAIMLPTGKVLIFGREPLSPDGTRSNLGSAQVFDPAAPGAPVRHVPPPVIASSNGMPAPLFCAGHTLLADGRVLVVGGNLAFPDPPATPYHAGLDYTFVFDPWTETWQVGPRMTHGRWYPTTTTLDSGDVLILGGLDEHGEDEDRNGLLDVLRPATDLTPPVGTLAPFPAGSRADPDEPTGELLPPDASLGLSLYPWTYTLPDGNVALAGPGQQDSAILDTDRALDRSAAPGSAWTQIGGLPLSPEPPASPRRIHQGGTGAMEPDMNAFGGSWNLLAMAGADDAGSGFHLARKTVDRLVAGPGEPAWDAHGLEHDPSRDLNRARFYASNIVLPDGGMVVVGGGVGADWRTPTSAGNYYLGEPPPPAGAGTVPDPPAELKQVELRRPGERSWRLGAAQQEHRTYHSTAWLLPDGRIVSAGDDGLPKLTSSRDNAEIYWPPYLFDGDSCALRPAIRGVGSPSAPSGARAWATLTYGEGVGVFSEHARPGTKAVLLAPASTTHGVDMNQRLVPLAVTSTVAGGGLNVTMPAAAAIAPPGYYMLFLIDPEGTPSTGAWVRVLAPQAAAAARGGAPALVSGLLADPRGRRCANPDGTLRAEPDPPSPGGPQISAPPPPAPPAAARLAAKLALERATVVRRSRRLELLATISALATRGVAVDLFAAGRHTRFSAPIDRRRRRVVVKRRIPDAQARLGTGIITLSYKGNDATFPQSVRLRAAPRAARLVATRPRLAAGRLRASGTISRAARGVVRLQLQFGDDGDRARTLELTAKIKAGRWSLDVRLSAAARAAIARRRGTLHSYALFTGYAPARMRGEMRSYQVLGAP